MKKIVTKSSILAIFPRLSWNSNHFLTKPFLPLFLIAMALSGQTFSQRFEKYYEPTTPAAQPAEGVEAIEMQFPHPGVAPGTLAFLGNIKSGGNFHDAIQLLILNADGNQLSPTPVGPFVYRNLYPGYEIQGFGISEIAQPSPGNDGWIICGEIDRCLIPLGGELPDGFLLRINTAGTILWAAEFGRNLNERFSDVIYSPATTNFYAVGYAESFTPNRAIYVVCIDVNGVPVWERFVGGFGGDDEAFAVIENPVTGEIVVTGITRSFDQHPGQPGDVFIGSFDPITGNLIHALAIGTPAKEEARGICMVPGNTGYALTGLTHINALGGSVPINDDILFLTTDLAHIPQVYISWGQPAFHQYLSSGMETGIGIFPDSYLPGYVISGTHNIPISVCAGVPGFMPYAFFLMHVDLQGGPQNQGVFSTKSYGSTADEFNRSLFPLSFGNSPMLPLQATDIGGYLLGGTTRSFGGSKMYLVRTDLIGRSFCETAYCPDFVSSDPDTFRLALIGNTPAYSPACLTTPPGGSIINTVCFSPNKAIDEDDLDPESGDASSAGIYPNPADTYLTFVTGDEGDISSLLVFDSRGRKIPIDHITRGSELILDISAMSKGIYFVRIMFTNGRVETGKFEVAVR